MKPTAPLFNANVPTSPSAGTSPLLLVVEASLPKRDILCSLFESLQCRVFMADNHAQAVMWAPILPFSAIILNGSLPDVRSMVVRRLHYLVQENLMPPIPIWAMVDTHVIVEKTYWHEVGVSTLLNQPLQHALLEPLCSALIGPEADFYLAIDAHLQGDFPASIVIRLPELSREIGKQVQQLHHMLIQLPDHAQPALISQQAHAVKSGASSLGYFRLAALMAEIEHTLASKSFEHLPQHWQIIADALDFTFFKEKERVSACILSIMLSIAGSYSASHGFVSDRTFRLLYGLHS